MKIKSLLALFVLTIPLGFTNAQPSEVVQCKSDLIGKTMGGREKCWKFQSMDQIKELAIQNKQEDGQQRRYSVSLVLQDPRAPGKYKAEALLVYEKADGQWKIKSVGLISMTKLE